MFHALQVCCETLEGHPSILTKTTVQPARYTTLWCHAYDGLEWYNATILYAWL